MKKILLNGETEILEAGQPVYCWKDILMKL